MKRLIYYPPGTYGTFINWLCNTTGPVTQADLPFAEFGNSHKFYVDNPQRHLFDEKSQNLFLKSSRDFGVLRVCWPLSVGAKLVNVEQKNDFYYQVCEQDLQRLAADCDRILVLHPTDQSKIWWYQNFSEKVTFSPDIVRQVMPTANLNDNSVSWLTTLDPVLRARHYLDLQKQQPGLAELFCLYDKTTSLDFELWQLRTALVYDLHSQTNNVYQCWQQLAQEFDTIKFVSLENLRDHFQQTAQDILNFFECGHSMFDNLSFVEAEWSKRQQHQFKDRTVNSIVDAVATNQELDWTGQINFFDEVYIQKLLNDRGITLLDVNTWPTNTSEFWNMIK
jgi:hypothetical protein